VVDHFAEEWAARAEAWWGEATTRDDILEVAGRLMDWAGERKQHATVYFVTSKGASVTIEDRRLAVTARIAKAAAEAVERASGRAAGSATALDALSVVTLLESSLRAELSMDATYRTLGPRLFRDEVIALCSRVLENAAA
jgi:hypothetical protein